MGNCFISNEKNLRNPISKEAFELLYPLGEGMFGTIWKSIVKQTGMECAIKEIKKSLIKSENSIKVILNERTILTLLNNNFIVNLLLAFQDTKALYLVLDQKLGGDLRYHLLIHNKFSEDQCRFFACCIICALEHLHAKGIIHRDIKPENLIFDTEGYLHLIDFGISSIIKYKNQVCSENSGTPGYMSPEALFRKPHGYASDFFGLGIVLYECLMGYRGFSGMNRREIMKEVLENGISIEPQAENGISAACTSFINSLLMKNPKKRLGKNGIDEIKNHPWLDSIDWTEFCIKKVKPAFKPVLQDNFKSFASLKPNYKRKLERIGNIDSRFIGYFYISPFIQILS